MMNVSYIHTGILFSCTEKLNFGICRSLDGPKNHNIKQDNTNSEDSNYTFSLIDICVCNIYSDIFIVMDMCITYMGINEGKA